MIRKVLRTLVPTLAVAVTASLFAPSLLHAQATPSLVTNRLTQPIDNSVRVTLRNTVSPLATAANDRGMAPVSMQLPHIQIVLKRSTAQQDALNQLIRAQHTAGSASYHKWLTPAQFGERFGPSTQDIQKLESWLESQGFSVLGVDPGRQTMNVSGSVSQFSQAFHAQIHRYEVNGQLHYANANNPQIPAALAPVFGGFVSLNDFHLKHYAQVLGHASYNPKTNKATPEWTYGNSQGESFVVAPSDFAKEYDVPSTVNGQPAGTGQTIAIINESNINVSLVNQYRTLFGLPTNPPHVIIDGNDPGIDGVNNIDGPNGASSEAYLDVEEAGAVAPYATIDLVIAADTALQSGLVLAAEHAVYSDLAPVMSVSFGSCEAAMGSENSFLNSLWEQAAAEGITVVVSTGDSGSAGCDDDNTQYYAVDGAQVSGFASTPYDVAVGGTDFYYSDYNQSQSVLNAQLGTYWNTTASQNPATSILGYIPEQPWNNSQYGLNAVDFYSQIGDSKETTISGGSGGASSAAVCSTSYDSSGNCTGTLSGYAQPAWQQSAAGSINHVRDIPDVSLFAANGLNYSYYPVCASDGDCQPASGSNLVQITGIGGTSASAPAFAGIMALVNQEYGRQGQADFTLYPLAAQFPAAFHDVTNGTNAVPCNTTTVTADGNSYAPTDCISVQNALTVTDPTFGQTTEGEIGTGTTPEYNAGTGYDLATGLGSVDTSVLLSDWGKVTFSGTTVSLTSPTTGTSITHGSSVTFTGTVAEAAGGTATPTGDVSIQTSSTEASQQALGFLTLSNGSFSGSLSTLPGGTYNVWAYYGGDANNKPAQSTPVQITVTPEASGIFFNALTPNGQGGYNLNKSGATFAYGSQIVLSALVAPSSQLSALESCETGSGTCPTFTEPTGSVTFSDSGTAINTASINTEGEAEYTPPAAFSVGSHSVTASYSGDGSYNASTASAIGFTITKAAPTVLITAPSNTVDQGQSLTFTILVESNGVGLAPTGTVSISGGPSGTPTSATLQAGVDPFHDTTVGIATITVPTTGVTSSALRPAHRKGFGGWLPAGGAALCAVFFFTIPARRRGWRKFMGLVVIGFVSLSLSATIGCGSSGNGSTGGGGGGGGGTGTVGTYTLKVSYAGDANYTSASGSTSFTVDTASTLATSTTSVTSSAQAPTPNSAVNVSVEVQGGNNVAPTGTVEFLSGSLSQNSTNTATPVELTSATLNPQNTGATSTATVSFNSSTLLQGANLLTVVYSGDKNYAGSSATINLSNPLSDFSMVPTVNAGITVPATGTANPDNINLTATNGFSGAVTLACTPPPGVTTLACAVSPGSVNLTGTGNSASAQLSVTTTAATAGRYEFNITATGSGPTVHTIGVMVPVQ